MVIVCESNKHNDNNDNNDNKGFYKIKINQFYRIKYCIQNMDSCLICLEDCQRYLKLSCCDCKNISHERCFREYVKNNNQIKCLICNKVKDLNKYDIALDSVFFSIIFMLQNIYFYIDDKYFPKNDVVLIRLFSVILFHTCLTVVLVIPYIIIKNIKYIIYKSMLSIF